VAHIPHPYSITRALLTDGSNVVLPIRRWGEEITSVERCTPF
jgi:hypothetical protein